MYGTPWFLRGAGPSDSNGAPNLYQPYNQCDQQSYNQNHNPHIPQIANNPPMYYTPHTSYNNVSVNNEVPIQDLEVTPQVTPAVTEELPEEIKEESDDSLLSDDEEESPASNDYNKNENFFNKEDILIFIKDANGFSKNNLDLNTYTLLGIEDADNIIKKGQCFTEKPPAFECPGCLTIFLHPKRFAIHYRWHTFGKLKSKKTMRREAIKQERLQKKMAEEEVELKCPECSKVFQNRKSYSNHRQRYHNTSPKECKYCHKVMSNWRTLRKHVIAVHMERDEYRCSQCPKTFKFPRSLQKHEDTHLEKTMACNQCDKKYGSELLLSIHMKTHEKLLKEKSFHCSYCGKGFYDAFTLAGHERTHRNERPFVCQICNTSFGMNSGLKRHMKVSHSSTKPWECPTCHRSFSTESIRDRHEMRTHGDPADFKYGCNMCTNRYMSNKDLQKHKSKVHGIRRRRKGECDDD